MSINKINDAINRTRLSVDLSLSFSYSPSLPPFPLSLLLTHSMSSCRYPRVDGNKKKKITDRFYIKNGTKGSRALARGSSMKNCRCVHSLPPGYRYAIHVGKYRGHECPSGLIGFSKLYLLFPGVSGRKTLSWSEVDSLMHLYNATFFLNKKKKKKKIRIRSVISVGEGKKKFASKGRNVPAGYRSTFKEERYFQANGRRGEKKSE